MAQAKTQTTQKVLQERTNHVILGIDRSGSMAGQPVIEVFDILLNNLKRKSIDFNQETRISVYMIDTIVECIVFDMDVMRFETLRGLWKADGSTPLRDCIGQAIEDHKKIPQLYGDHAFLMYVLTDGEENTSSHYSVPMVRNLLATLPDNWTLAGLVPDQSGKLDLKDLGFPDDALSIWNTAEKDSLVKVGKAFDAAMGNYMTARSTGAKKVSGLFTLDSSKLTVTAAKKSLSEVSADSYELLTVRKEAPIKEYVESWTKKPYRMGSGYYMPTKKVKIQDNKTLLVQDIKNGKIYEGDKLRGLLGLPQATVEVDPGQHKNWRIFVQSNSVNRKLFPNTFLLVRQ